MRSAYRVIKSFQITQLSNVYDAFFCEVLHYSSTPEYSAPRVVNGRMGSSTKKYGVERITYAVVIGHKEEINSYNNILEGQTQELCNAETADELRAIYKSMNLKHIK